MYYLRLLIVIGGILIDGYQIKRYAASLLQQNLRSDLRYRDFLFLFTSPEIRKISLWSKTAMAIIIAIFLYPGSYGWNEDLFTATGTFIMDIILIALFSAWVRWKIFDYYRRKYLLF